MECVVCFSHYDEGAHRPLCLPCGHSVCQDCVTSMSRDGRAFFCPNCRLEIQGKTVIDFPVNFSLIGTASLCTDVNPPAQPDQHFNTCDLHPAKKVKFHCSICAQDFCSKCVTRHAGDNHKIEDLALAVDRQLDQMLLETRKVEAKFQEMQTKLEDFERKNSEMRNLQGNVNKHYQDSIAFLQKQQEDAIALLEKNIQENNSALEIAKVEFSKRNSAFLEAQNLLRNARFSVSKLHEKRANLVKVTETFSEIWNREKGEMKEFEGPKGVILVLKQVKSPEKLMEIGEIEAEVQVEQPESPEKVEVVEEFKAAVPSLPRRKEAGKAVAAKASLPRDPGSSKVRAKGPGWYYMSDGLTWSPYIPAQTRAIEEAFQAKAPSIDLGKYLIDFATMTQMNKATKKTRKVGREIPAN